MYYIITYCLLYHFHVSCFKRELRRPGVHHSFMQETSSGFSFRRAFSFFVYDNNMFVFIIYIHIQFVLYNRILAEPWATRLQCRCR